MRDMVRYGMVSSPHRCWYYSRCEWCVPRYSGTGTERRRPYSSGYSPPRLLMPPLYTYTSLRRPAGW